MSPNVLQWVAYILPVHFAQDKISLFLQLCFSRVSIDQLFVIIMNFLEETHRLDFYVLYVCEPVSCYLIRSMSQFLASRRRTTKHLDCNLYQKCFYCIVVSLFRSNNPQPSVNSMNSERSKNSVYSTYKQFIARCCLYF